MEIFMYNLARWKYSCTFWPDGNIREHFGQMEIFVMKLPVSGVAKISAAAVLKYFVIDTQYKK
jgi:hypothetical protein